MKDQKYIAPEMKSYKEFPASEAEAVYPGTKEIISDPTSSYPYVHLNQVYASEKETDLHIHVITPVPPQEEYRNQKFPLILFIQGSGWQKQKLGTHLAHLIEFAKRGYVIGIVEYRYAPDAVFPAQVLDVKSAVRFLYKNKEKYNIIDDRVILWGDSSGGHTAVMVAVTEFNQAFSKEANLENPLNIAGVIDFYGPTVLHRMNFQPSIADHVNADSLEGQLFGRLPILDHVDLVENANPINYLTNEKLAPILIMHGDKDRLVPFEQSVLLYDGLKQAEKEVEFYKMVGSDHSDDSFFTTEVMTIVNRFIQVNINGLF